MSFGSFEQGNNSQPLSEINTTPLVDVMLVLLIIFMITAPLMTQSIQVNLPSHGGAATAAKPDIISLQIGADGALRWNDEAITQTVFSERLAVAAQQTPAAELQVLADKAVRYEHVAYVMAQARDKGVTHLGFVMQAGANHE